MITMIISKVASMLSKKISFCLGYVFCCFMGLAILFGLKSVAEFMLENVSKELTMDNPFLINLAAICDNKDIVQILLKKGYDINSQDRKHFSPIYTATIHGHRKMVEFLIENGADVNQKTKSGFTSIHAAVWFNKPEVTKVLLQNGAQVDQPLHNGLTALIFASFSGKSKVAQILINIGANIEATDQVNYNWTSLHWAAIRDKRETVRMLLKNQANINCRDIHGNTPLHLSIKKGSYLVCKTLLEFGADLDALNHWKYSCLHLAIKNGYRQIAQVLLKCGISLDARNVHGNNAFEYSLTKKEKAFDIFKIMTFHQTTR